MDFILNLGCALHEYGTPSFRFEEAMQSVTGRLGLKGQFFSVPTSIMAHFETPEGEYNRLIRVQPGQTHLEKLCRLDELGDAVVAGRVDPEEGSRRVRAILRTPERYPGWLTVVCHGISSASVAVFFRAGVSDMLAALLVGFAVGGVDRASKKFKRINRVQEALAAVVATLLASALAVWLPRASVPVVVLAGLISLMPGLTLTVAMSELATQNLVAGTARLMMAVTILLELIFGVALGTKAAELMGLAAWTTLSSPVTPWLRAPALLAAALSFTVLYRARPRDAGWITVAGILGYLSAVVGMDILGPTIGVFAGGWAVGAASNAFARALDRPATVILLPGIVLLVPGSLGFKSLSSLLDHDVLTGVDTAFTMMVTAAAIVGGLLFGNVTVTPKRSL